ncbi:MAG: WD40 repeat domain-containing protein [Trichormus sp.]
MNLINFEFIFTFILPKLIYATLISVVIGAVVGGIIGLIIGKISRRMKDTLIPAMLGSFIGMMLLAMIPIFASRDTYIGGPFGGLAIFLKFIVVAPTGSIIGGVVGGICGLKLSPQFKPRFTLIGLIFTYSVMLISIYATLAPLPFQFVKSGGQEENFLPNIGKIIGYEQKFGSYYKGISCLGFTRDGNKLVVANSGDLRVWQIDPGKLLNSFPRISDTEGYSPLTDSINAIAITPDGKTLVTAAPEQIQIRELETGNILRRLEGGYYLKLTPDGKTLIGFRKVDKPTADVGVWELSSGKLLRTLPANIETLYSSYPVDITPDGKTVVVANSSYSNQIEIWDINTGKRLQSFGDNQGKLVTTLAVTPDGKTLITAQNNNLQIWDINTKKILRTIPNVGTVNTLLVTPDNQTLISQGEGVQTRPTQISNYLYIWQLSTGKKLLSGKKPPKFSLTKAALSPDGKTLAVSDHEGVRLWRLALNKLS